MATSLTPRGEYTILTGQPNTQGTVVSSLYSLCINRIKRSRNWEHCILSIPVKAIRFDLLTMDMHRNPVIVIATHYNMSDGEIATGLNCGYHVFKQRFLIGSFKACVYSEPRDHTQWFCSLSVQQVVVGEMEGNLSNALETANGKLEEKDVRLCLQSINAWVEKHNVPLKGLV